MDHGFRRLMDLLGEALDQPEAERDAWLVEECAEDTELLAEARTLLQFTTTASRGGLTLDLESRVARAATDVTASYGRPDRIGRYAVVGLLGEGGMGRVYAARQEAPIGRDVALKLARADAMRPHLRDRFEVEMQMLATLDHPNIGRLYDGGSTERGDSYFVMERIDGVPITVFCDTRAFGTSRRLELFLGVLRAVGHAHQNAVVHRDLKPSNILVTEVDGEPVPKLIDFGIALALAGPTDDATRHQARTYGTPDYMSPEAKAGAVADTRTDIYSLGVLLYELLAARLPRGDHERCESDGRPDARSEGKLETDLACIVNRAMAADPSERYQTVVQLADEIKRYLAGRPVEARSGGASYKLRRFIVRHRFPVLGASTAVLAVLTITAAFVLRLAEERDRVRFEADRALETAQFLQALFEAPDPGSPGSADLTARELLDVGTARIATGLADQPDLRASLLGVIAASYEGLGLWGEAEARLLEALELERGLKGPRHPDVAGLLHDLGHLRNFSGKLAEGEEVLREALSIRREALGAANPASAHTMSELGLVLRNAGRLEEAETLASQAVDILRGASSPEDDDRLSAALHNLAFVLRTQERLAESEALYREALALRRARHDPSHPEVLSTSGNLAVVLERRGRYDEAETLLRQALDARRARLGPEHPQTLTALNNLAYLQWRVGRLVEAESSFREALSLARVAYRGDHTSIAIMMNNLGVAARRSGDPQAAASLHREALEMNRRLLGPEHPRIAGDLDNLGRALLAAGDPMSARALHEEALAMRTRLLGDDHPTVAESLSGLAAARIAAGAPSAGVTLLRRALELLTTSVSPENPRVAAAAHELGVALREAGELREAEARLREALDMRLAALGPGHPDVGVTQRELAALLRRTGRLAEAARLLDDAGRHTRDRLGPEHADARAIQAESAALAAAMNETGPS